MDLFRVTNMPLWSTTKITAVGSSILAADYPLFAVGIGGTGQGYGTTPLTLVQTNLNTSGMLPNEWGYQVDAISIEVIDVDVPAAANTADLVIADYKKIYSKVVLKWDMPDYKEDLGLLKLYPAGFGVQGNLSIGATNAGYSVTNGLPTIGAVRKLRNPIMIPAGAAFKLNCNVPTAIASMSGATVAYEVLCVLWGTRTARVNQ